ncbi:type II toxin-antitoxin system HicB family antitoxin [Marinifilum caeruleilacunae]|uniref:Type II toxin-antitoxin system HicB family antitoxin n=1 Tax=Marinifilum caeruleilacunae TaxID=2499076 RepID=A0ABX1X2M3_9BACT|nr:type II toxin-antitoxin system HicB family antitoxin [Marinifilum caeruleilacunae]NOU62344.1 type II toxin-antitoxin system HicB family antitoxin [Marinifilum caeruleilacunae]
MNTLTYKNFIGSFNYIEEDDILHGKIEGIIDLVTFEGDSIAEIKEAFIEAVDDYLYICKEVGKEPLKSYKGSFNVRVSSDLHRDASMLAVKRKLNLNQFVKQAIENEIKREDDCCCC